MGCAWAIGLVFGGIAVVGMLELGVVGIGFAALAIGLIAWKGPRLIGVGGLMCGLGLGLVLLLGPAAISCANEDAAVPGSCSAAEMIRAAGVSVAILIGGVLATIAAIARSRTAG
jgi:hypothetical protein